MRRTKRLKRLKKSAGRLSSVLLFVAATKAKKPRHRFSRGPASEVRIIDPKTVAHEPR